MNWAVRAVVAAGLVATGAFSSGCANAGEGAASGALLGFGVGSIIGSTTGDFGAGALIGSAIGAAGGAIVGDQNERADRRAAYYGYYGGPHYAGPERYYSTRYYAPEPAYQQRVIIRQEWHGGYYRDNCSDW